MKPFLENSLNQSSACDIALEESPIHPPPTSLGAEAQYGPLANLDELPASEVYSRFGRQLRPPLWHRDFISFAATPGAGHGGMSAFLGVRQY